MAGFLPPVVRRLANWIFRCIQHILRIVYGYLMPLALKAFRILKPFIGRLFAPAVRILHKLTPFFAPLLPPAIKTVRFLKSCAGLLALLILKLFLFLRSFIQSLLSLQPGRLLAPAVSILHNLKAFLAPLLRPAIKTARFLKSCAGLLTPIILKLLDFLRSSVQRLQQLPDGDESELKTIAKGKPRGLQNLGNTCYFNSVMQPLCHTYIFEELFRELPASGELTKSFRDFHTNMHSGESESCKPDALHHAFGRECSRFDNNEQHDSHECLRHFMDAIRTEERNQRREKRTPGSSNETLTVVDRVFGGHLMTVYVCMTCQCPYHICEPCLDISLPILFERSKDGGEQRLRKAEKDIQMTATGKELEIGDDETTEDSEDEKTSKDEICKREGREYQQNKSDDEEEEDTEEDEEKEAEEEKKTEVKEEELDQTDKNAVNKIDTDKDDHRGIWNYEKHEKEEQRERKQNEKGGKTKARDNETEEEDIEENKETDNDEEVDKHVDTEQNEEEREEEEEEEALETSHYKILEEIRDREGKQVEEEKHQREKEEVGENERRKKKKEKERKTHKKLCKVKRQDNFVFADSDEKEAKVKPPKMLNPKCPTEKVNDVPEVINIVKEQSGEHQTHRSTLSIPENQELPEESNPYREAIRLLTQILGVYSSTHSSSNDEKPKSVEDCLAHFTRKEHIKDEYLCRECQKKKSDGRGDTDTLTSATKQTLIFNPPAILTLHLKRFEVKRGGSVKRTDVITYGERLDIAPYCSSMCLRNDPPSRNIWYSLYAVVVHSGSLQFGHYTAYVKAKRSEQWKFKRFLQTEYVDRGMTEEQLIEMTMNRHRSSPSSSLSDEVWYLANDSNIREVSLDEVLNQEAYLLFYERLS